MGAADPTSGTVSLHEVIKGFGTLLKQGWRPLRNIVIASWDAEEVSIRITFCDYPLAEASGKVRPRRKHRIRRGFLGVDHGQCRCIHQPRLVLDYCLQTNLYLMHYIFLDVSVAGSQWNPAGSPSLAHLIRQVASELPHPTDPTRTLWDARTDKGPYAGEPHADSVAAYEAQQKTMSEGTGVSPLGSGSDFTAFLQRLGVSFMCLLPSYTKSIM